ncbi:MAG: hypothetical protein QOE68_1227 [Thermoanaerobaculia bacterium]|jgi:hypothetical protein|nr:hypothetical protein [Thermoanaerobaculia bacterium]
MAGSGLRSVRPSSLFAADDAVDPSVLYSQEQFWQVYGSDYYGENSFVIYTALDNITLTTGGGGAGFVELVGDPNQTAVFVFADTVTLSGNLSLPGQTVTIVARIMQVEGDAVIDVSGVAGSPPSVQTPQSSQAGTGSQGGLYYSNGGTGGAGQPGGNGTGGAPGGAGGSIQLWVGALQATNGSATLTLNANGGQGGYGQDGQIGQQGGDGGIGIATVTSREGETPGSLGGSGGAGGAGGDGGTGGTGGMAGSLMGGVVSTSGVTLSWNALGGTGGNGGAGGQGGDGGNAGSNGEGTTPEQGGGGGNGGAGGLGGNGGGAGAPGPITTTVPAVILMITALPEAANAVTTAMSQYGTAGAAGSGGTGGSTVSNKAGANPGGGGVNAASSAGSPAGTTYFSGSSFDNDGVWRESAAPQALMLLQKVKLFYLMGDPTNQVGTLLGWLVGSAQSYGAMNGIPDLAMYAAIGAEASALLTQFQQGRDYYGNLPTYAPRPALSFYTAALTPMLGLGGNAGTLNAIEDAYNAYFTQLNSAELSTDTLNTALAQVQVQLGGSDPTHPTPNSLPDQLSKTVALANGLIPTIAADQAALSAQATILDTALANYQADLEAVAAGECILQSIIQAGSMFASAEGVDSTMVSDLSGDASSGVSWVFGQMPSGTALQQSTLISQLGVLQGSSTTDLNASAASAWTNYSSEVQNNTYMLLSSEDQMNTLFGQYTNAIPGSANPDTMTADAKSAVDAINTYIAEVQKLNADIIAYNGYVNQVASILGQIQQATVQQGQLQTSISNFNQQNAELPALVAFMGKLYDDARSVALSTLYQAYRAYMYWSLYASFQGFGALAGLSNPEGIDATSLAAAWTNSLMPSFQTAVANASDGPESFPASPSEAGASGLTYTLTADQNPGLFATLLKLNSANLYTMSFVLPAWSSGQPAAQSNQPANPFVDKVNVRINKARPWLTGATVTPGNDGSEMISVDIIHTGGEWIISSDGVTKNRFTHEPILQTFTYNQAVSPQAIQIDTDFAKTDDQGNAYAAPSPFTIWTIVVDPNENPGLDMSKVTQLEIEFWGNFYAFVSN